MSYRKDSRDEQDAPIGTAVGCCTPASVELSGQGSETFSCGCETAPPAAGEGACCGRPAAKFGIEVKAERGCGCS